MLRALLISCLVGACAVVGLGVVVSSRLNAPTDPQAPEKIFVIRPGSSLHQIARELAQEGLLEDGWLGTRALVVYARIRQLEREVKSGEYRLSAAMSPREILDHIVSGRVATHPVTLPPGFTAREIAAQLAADELIDDPDAFLSLVFSAELAKDLEIEAESLEGYLYPETYRFQKHTAEEKVVRTLVEHFKRAWRPEDHARLQELDRTLHQVVTLASIVEKETGVESERPRIAGVFQNRLERGMLLQSDPTVIYGILVTRGSFDGNIRRSDLREDTPYNTYTRRGIPPGPIASPGIEAIRAVLQPEDHSFLYFVSMNDGTHYFSKTLREHNNAVNRYQRLRGRQTRQ